MNYPPNNVVFVNAQPKQYDIQSHFGMFPGERLLYHTEMKTGCCQGGNNYYTSVTDTRYVVRNEEFVCCGCCCQRPYLDTCIYLNDITELREVRGDNGCCIRCCQNCWPCLCCCRLMISKRLQFRGTFGSHTIHIYGKDRPDFELMITEAIARHKLLN
jgi:hypothetical protein